MTSKEKKMKAKKKNTGNVKLTHSTRKHNLWPDLPQQLINLIARNSSMMKDIYSKGVTKSWKTESSRKCRSNYLTPPWLQLSADYGNDHNQSHTFNMPFKVGSFWYYCCERRNLAIGYNFLGSRDNGASDSVDYKLWEAYPDSGGWWNIPRWDAQVPFLSAVLSSYPLTSQEYRRTMRAKSIVIVLTGISHPAFVYYRIWEEEQVQEWIKKDSTIVDPYCSDPSQTNHLLRLCNGVWFEGKFYALSLQGTVVVIEDIDSELRITSIGKRVVPSNASMHYRECMVESGGNVVVVFLISRNCIDKADYVEVYELNTDELTWTKKHNLGDLAVFLSADCCMGVSAKRVGCRRNCIYFSLPSCDGWWVYDMKTSIITPTKFVNWVDPELQGS